MQIADLILIITRFENTHHVCLLVLECCCRYAARYLQLHQIAISVCRQLNVKVEVDVGVSVLMEVVRQHII